MAIKKTLRELEEEEGQKASGLAGLNKPKEVQPDFQGQLLTLVQRTTDSIAKLNVEYGKYFSGAEKRPPVQERENLEALVKEIHKMKKHGNSPSLNFKVNAVLNSYLSYKTVWDKKLQELEKASR